MNYIKFEYTDFLIIAITLVISIMVGVGLVSSQISNPQRVELIAEIIYSESPTRAKSFTREFNSFVDSKLSQQEIERIELKNELIKENFMELKEYLRENDLEEKYGIYFNVLNFDQQEIIGHNESERFYPASIYKIALAMMVLDEVEAGNIDLAKIVEHEDKPKSLKRVMELMITESNNDAMGIFERELGGYYKSQEKLESELNVEIKRIGQVTTPQDLGKIFEELYRTDDNAYLSKSNRNLLLEIIDDTVPLLKDRIPAALEVYNEKNTTELKASTKIGTLNGVYQDGGIIWGDKSDYVLVIMNKQRLTYDAIEEITNITEILLTNLE